MGSAAGVLTGPMGYSAYNSLNVVTISGISGLADYSSQVATNHYKYGLSIKESLDFRNIDDVSIAFSTMGGLSGGTVQAFASSSTVPKVAVEIGAIFSFSTTFGLGARYNTFSN